MSPTVLPPPAPSPALPAPADPDAWAARFTATRTTLARHAAALDTPTLGAALLADLPAVIAAAGGDAADAEAALRALLALEPAEQRRDHLLTYWAHAVRIMADDPAPLLRTATAPEDQ